MLPPFPCQPSGVKEVDDMMVRLQEIRRVMVGENTPRTPTGVSPFVPEVLGEVLPLGARLPHLESYDRSSDPKEHVYYFVNTMQLHNFSDAILCKMFSTTLKGVAQTWFNQLPGGTITSF